MQKTEQIIWTLADGNPVACDEKLKILNENLAEIREVCQDAFEDGLLMGCDPQNLQKAFIAVINSLVNPRLKS